MDKHQNKLFVLDVSPRVDYIVILPQYEENVAGLASVSLGQEVYHLYLYQDLSLILTSRLCLHLNIYYQYIINIDHLNGLCIVDANH